MRLHVNLNGTSARRAELRPRRSARRGSFVSLLLVSLFALSACDKKETPAEGERPSAVEDKQARLEALLKENGLDPSSLPSNKSADPQGEAAQATAPAAASAAAAQPAAPAGAANSQNAPAQPAQPATQQATPVTIKVLSAGAAPRTQLRYAFKPGSQHKFALEIDIAVQRKIDGQLTPSMPPFALGLKGSTVTLSADPLHARRQNTFLEMVPNVTGMPPEMVEQIKAQYASLAGLQLTETVSTRGVMIGMELDERAIHPQVLALMQHLQDGMTNAFLPLPEEAVGAGARWVATTITDAAGLSLMQENEISLESLQGSKAQVNIKLKQQAKPNKIQGANLPPGVVIDVTKLEGQGRGTMSVDFQNITIASKVELSTVMQTVVTQPESPAPIREDAETMVKAQINIEKQ